MIVVDIANAERQIAPSEGMRKAMVFLQRQDLPSLPDGKTEIDGDRVFAITQRYRTEAVDAPKFEYHRSYADIQYLVSGEEIIGWAPVERMTVTDAYDPVKDICFGSVEKGKWTPLFIQAGQLAVLWPEDAHAPRLATGGSGRVMKIVVKVRV